VCLFAIFHQASSHNIIMGNACSALIKNPCGGKGKQMNY